MLASGTLVSYNESVDDDDNVDVNPMEFTIYYLLLILLTSDMKFERFGMRSDERLGIVDNEGEVAATASAGHLPGEDIVHSAIVRDGLGDIAVVQFGVTYIGGGYHAGEHGYLGLEGGFISCSESGQVFLQDGIPAGISSIGKGLDLGRGDILALDYRAAGLAGLHRDHHEVLLEETEGHLIIGTLDLLGPEIVVIVVTAQTRDADTDRVLRTGDVAVLTLGVILEAEDEAGQHLGIHLGELDGPDLLDHLTGAGAQAAAVAHIKGGLQRDGEGPAGMVLTDVGLVDPSASYIQPGWNS